MIDHSAAYMVVFDDDAPIFSARSVSARRCTRVRFRALRGTPSVVGLHRVDRNSAIQADELRDDQLY